MLMKQKVANMVEYLIGGLLTLLGFSSCDKIGNNACEYGVPNADYKVLDEVALTQSKLERLLASGLRAITVSLDGLGDDHDWMRGVPGSFKRASESISMISSVPDLVSDVVTCVNRKNYGELQRIKEYLWSLGVKSWRLFTVFPVGRAAKDSWEDTKAT